MIVIMSTDDETVIKNAKSLAKPGEQVVFFREGCFEKLATQERVVFVGHAHQYKYGTENVTPSAFLDKLNQFHFPFHKTKQNKCTSSAVKLEKD